MKKRTLLLSVLLLLGVALTVILIDRPSLEPYPFVSQANGDTTGLSATFLGTASILFRDGETSILTDGFFTRPSIGKVMFGTVSPDTAIIQRTLARLGVKRLDAVIVLHSHYDHVLDAPEIARRTGALLVGSSSTAYVGRGYGLDTNRIVTVTAGDTLTFGRFSVTFIGSHHVPLPWLLGGRILGKDNTEPLAPPARADSYLEGEDFAILLRHPDGTAAVTGSAGYRKGFFNGMQADNLFLSIAGLSRTNDAYRQEYFGETVTALHASRVIPIHWDNFTLPLDEPLRLPPRFIDDFDETMRFLYEKMPGDHIVLLQAWGRTGLSKQGKE